LQILMHQDFSTYLRKKSLNLGLSKNQGEYYQFVKAESTNSIRAG